MMAGDHHHYDLARINQPALEPDLVAGIPLSLTQQI